MNGKDVYKKAAKSYVDGFRELFTPSGPSAKEKGIDRGPVSYKDLAGKAEQLSPISDRLTEAITSQLADADPAVSMEGSTRMLAKALADLEISAQLLQAAEDEENKIDYIKSAGAERSVRILDVSKEYLDILLGEAQVVCKERAPKGGPLDIGEARLQLTTSIADSLTLISERANKAAQSSFGGIAGLGAGELAKAAGTVGMSIAEIFGLAEKVSRLYDLFRSFIKKVYDALAALVGGPLMKKVGEKAIEWLNELKGGKYFKEILEALYQTNPTIEKLKKLVADSPAALGKFVSAIEGVDALKDSYGKQTKLVEKLLTGLKYIGGLSDNILPQSKLIFAAAYIALGGYVVLAGADYVDSPQIKWLDRVAGVSRVVETNIA